MREDEVPLLEEGSEGSVIQRIWVESKKIWQIAGPAIFSRVALYAMTLIIQAFAGHLGNLDLAAISIASTVIISIIGYGKRFGEEFLFIMSRILAGFDIDTVMGSAVADAVDVSMERDWADLCGPLMAEWVCGSMATWGWAQEDGRWSVVGGRVDFGL
ncbi:hypothetical protein NE237_003508 [Protea cynaroides]|uniref:Uncharacterized protein n=1 Tax=Protea cynaroides TaxID=273540 RepID=A0A9Q0QST2_9MAGN|nr:hypothetical protein NE237_003508 [Protea cynaroides]